MDLIEKNNHIIKLKSKALFFGSSYSPQKIAMLTGADEHDVLSWIFGDGVIHHTRNNDCWFYKKEISGVNVVGGLLFREIEPILIASSKAATISILTSQLEKMLQKYTAEDSEEEMDIDEVKKLVDIFTNIDKIDRLEQGRATSITETKLDRMDATEIVAERRKRSDYIIDVESKEIH